MFIHESEENVACNFNCLFENEGLLKVIVRHVHSTLNMRQYHGIGQSVQDEVVVTRPTDQ